MKKIKGTLKICSKGHEFYKNSDCPVCPKCSPEYYAQHKSDFPKLGAPALRALINANITNLSELSKYSEKEILSFHGMGPASIPALKAALTAKGLSLKEK